MESLPPTDANLALHVQRAHLQMLLWKAADKCDPPDIQLTDYGWEVKEHEHVMPAVSREPAAPSKLMDVISCSCKAEGKACSGRCSCGSSAGFEIVPIRVSETCQNLSGHVKCPCMVIRWTCPFFAICN